MKIDKVLMVDDDDYIRKIAEISLRKVGKWEVCVATCGQEALVMANDNAPDVILMDVSMPDLDGPSTFNKLKESQATSAIPVIFLTGRVLNEEVEEYRKLGVAGVINKPFDPMKLPAEIRRLLNAD